MGRYVARMRNEYIIFIGEPEEKDLSEDLGIDGKITLEGIL